MFSSFGAPIHNSFQPKYRNSRENRNPKTLRIEPLKKSYRIFQTAAISAAITTMTKTVLTSRIINEVVIAISTMRVRHVLTGHDVSLIVTACHDPDYDQDEYDPDDEFEDCHIN